MSTTESAYVAAIDEQIAVIHQKQMANYHLLLVLLSIVAVLQLFDALFGGKEKPKYRGESKIYYNGKHEDLW